MPHQTAEHPFDGQVLIGFDVTPQMAAFNRDGKRFRVNAGAAAAPAAASTALPRRVVSADRHAVKLWSASDGAPFTSITPADGGINDVLVWPGSTYPTSVPPVRYGSGHVCRKYIHSD